MDNYEIRIIQKGHKAPVVYACPHASDYAAVRKAQSLIQEGDELEVWRDMDCIYSTHAMGRIPA